MTAASTAKSPNRGVVVFGACLTQFTIIGLLFAYGLFFKVFEDEFGWSRTILSACAALSTFMMGLLAIFAGRLNDTYGPRIVLGISGTCYGIGFILMSLISQPWHLVLIFGTLLSIGLSTHDVVTLSTIARWFPKRRGIMSGVVKSGTAAGQVVVPPITAALLLAYGWQATVIIFGISAMLLLWLAAFCMARPVVAVSNGLTSESDGLTFAQAKSTRTLWQLFAIQFLFFPTMMAVPLHMPVHGMDLGMTPTMAATLLSVMGGASVVGRLVVGRFVDLIGGKRTFAICFIPLIISLTAFLTTETFSVLFACVALYGFGHGGLFTVVSPTVAEYFGLKAHGAIFGAILFCGTVGGALGPVFAGWIFDTTGSYQIAFATLLAMACVSFALAMLLPARKIAED